MKTLVILFLATALICGCSCKAAFGQTHENPIGPVETKVVELTVTGMTCQGCADHVASALSKKEGVIKTDVKFAENSASVTYDPAKINETEIINTVNATGYKTRLKSKNKNKESKNIEESVKINEESVKINNDVSFYEVPLVCAAAPQIGCGSKARPVLSELERKNTAVSEAWLNREGTVIAVVWQKGVSSKLRKATAESVFGENNMQVTGLSGREYKNALSDFSNKQNWYRGTDVDKLSLEEADVIARRLVARVNSKTSLSKEKSEKLQNEIASVFKSTFLNLNPAAGINSNENKVYEQNERKTEDQLLEVGNKHLNEAEMNALKDAISLGWRPTETERKNLKSCCIPKKAS